MNKIFKIYALFFVCMAAFACTKSDDSLEGPKQEAQGVVLVASTPTLESVSSSRASLTDEGSTGVITKWEAGDDFSIYNEAGERLGDFVLSGTAGAKSGTFEQVGVFLMPAGSYTAVFPAAEGDLASREMDKVENGEQSEAAGLTHIEDNMKMMAQFDYNPMSSSSTELVFKQPFSLLTVTFEAPEGNQPEKIVLRNGEDVEYTHNFSLTAAAADNLYTASFQVAPNTLSTERLFHYRVTFSDSSTKNHTVSGDLNYQEGNRYSDNLGTMNDYIPIYDANELQAINTDTATKSGKYILANDIDLTDVTWTSISIFTGKFNGNNKTISNLLISSTGNDQGLFGYIQDAEVFNLNMKNVTVGIKDETDGGRWSYGAVVGTSVRSTIRNITVESVNIYGKTRLGGAIGLLYLGANTVENISVKTVALHSKGTEDDYNYRNGIAGVIGSINGDLIDDSERQTINNISAEGVNITVESAEDSVGGAVGNLYNADASNIAASDVTIIVAAGTIDVGGVVGLVELSEVADIYANNIYISSDDHSAGGAVGKVDQVSTLNRIYVKKLTLEGTYAIGGAVGYITGTSVLNDLEIESATLYGSHWVGGAVGQIENSSIENVKVDASTAGDDGISWSHSFSYEQSAGGAIGLACDNSTISDIEVTNCNVSGRRNLGGVIGQIAGSKELKNLKADGITIETLISGATIENIGGVIGWVNKSALVSQIEANNIDFNYNTAKYEGGKVGGAVGYLLESDLEYAKASNIKIESANITGGVIGFSDGLSTIKSKVSFCTLEGDYQIQAGVGNDLGGVIGLAHDSRIIGCHTMDVSTALTNKLVGIRSIGGVVGAALYSDIIACSNAITNITSDEVSGVINSGAGIDIGGVIGYLEKSTATACYNIGDINATSGITYSNIGGIIGLLKDPDNISINACYNYNTTALTGATNVGQILGSNNNSSSDLYKINNCLYQSGQVIGNTISGNIQNVNGNIQTMSKQDILDHLNENISIMGIKISYVNEPGKYVRLLIED